MRRKFSWSCLLAICICAFFPSFAGAASSGWVEVKSPHFVVVSNAGDKEARRTALQFEQIRDVFREVMPYAKDHSGPVTTIFAVKDQQSLDELLPEMSTKGHARVAGFFEQGMNQFCIAIELDAKGPNPYATIYHEYYHSLTTPYLPHLPTWLAEGMADFYGHSTLDGNTARVGEPAPELLYQLRSETLLPLDMLFHVDRSSPYYNEENKVTMFYAESWALVHYLMNGDNQAHRRMLNAYLAALDAGDSEEDAAAKAFGNLKTLQGNLQNYIDRDAFFVWRYPAPSKIADSDLKERALSEADIDAYEGGFFALRARTDDATKVLDQAVKLDPKNARAYENLAITQFSSDQRMEALASATQAITLDPGSLSARYLRAYLTLSEAPNNRNPQIEADLREVITGDPEFASPYGLLAVYMAAQGEDLPAALELAKKGIALEPGNADYQLDEAQVLLRMRNYAEADAALTRARTSAASSQQLLQIDIFRSTLEQMQKEEVSLAAGTKRAGTGAFDDDPNALEATGTVTDASCSPKLELRVSTPNGALTLHTGQNGDLKIEASFAIPANFTPCGLKGSRITARYKLDAPNATTGTVDVLKVLEAAP
jgi:tetratricopeptide (TPR) repeat protein